MKKLWIILLAAAAFACGDSRRSANDEPTEDTEQGVEEGSGEDISPQLVPGDSLENTRYDVDTISSAAEAEQQSQLDSVD